MHIATPAVELIAILLIAPLVGFAGATFLRWARLILDGIDVPYWWAYRLTVSGMILSMVLALPLRLLLSTWPAIDYATELLLSVLLQGAIYGRWLRDRRERPIGLGRGIAALVLQTGFALLALGVLGGIWFQFMPRRGLVGAMLAVICLLILLPSALYARRQRTQAILIDA